MRALRVSLVALLSFCGVGSAITGKDIVEKIDYEKVQRLISQDFTITTSEDGKIKQLPIKIDPLVFRPKAFGEFANTVFGSCNPTWAGLKICTMAIPGDYVMLPYQFYKIELCRDPYTDGTGYNVFRYERNNGIVRAPSSGCGSTFDGSAQRNINDIPRLGSNEPAWMDPPVYFATNPSGLPFDVNDYNGDVQSTIIGGVTAARPSVYDLTQKWGVTIGDTYKDEGWEKEETPDDTGGGDDGTGTSNPFPNDQSAGCNNEISKVNLFQRALAWAFLPCKGFNDRLDDLKDQAYERQPLGYLSWVRGDDFSQASVNEFGAGDNISGVQVTCIGKSWAIEGQNLPCVKLNGENEVFRFWHEKARPMLGYLVWAAFIAFILRRLASGN